MSTTGKLYTSLDVARKLRTYRHRVMAMIALAGITPARVGGLYAIDEEQFRTIRRLHFITPYRRQGRPRLSPLNRN